MNMLLIKNAEVHSPVFLGIKDILIAGEKIIAVENEIDARALKSIEIITIDGTGKRVIPGLIDAHVHVAGAGGEGGPATRTPEMQLSHMLDGGITTVVGCLGTDGFTRSLEAVLMKVKSLKAQGVSAYMYTGSYQVPTPTLLGDVGRDIALIEEVIGIGEIAISDHRSSCPSTAELIRLVEHARVGGMLGGKAGIANMHMGDARDPFRPIYDAVENSELKLTQFFPTHCNRNPYIFEDAKAYGKKGYVDLTASSYPYDPENEIKPSKAIVELLSAGVPLEHITLTSDGNGSLPNFDREGRLISMDMGLPKSIMSVMIDTVTEENLPLETAVAVVTSNVASILRLRDKGRIEPGKDADIVILDKDYAISDLISRGQMMTRNYERLKKGTYE
ncbi:MAG TPA: beta-aspartyl-peptidase [Bacteroidales bacterium]|jgi:beta-aspartyl-dipeptidase (metallo-type)|nr:beta-aspartyl-peptidase [Bacteroidales bacterium]HNY56806.1 beta-aspartyl-peptidase [Bacteroidales bacterium]HOC48587.1 beta-aspartyl-peptidase [Bacteroidales bacterium]HOH14392.1 beta-aspartyl-peptidase [Bacteroidales bacterium]HPX52779.1 beta-aspartyl-peptidase [Bacteroidales bacterium]